MTKKIDRQAMLTKSVPAWEREVTAAFVELAKMIGLMPVVGEVAAKLYFSQKPLSKKTLEQELLLSHGSVQNAIDTLRAFGVLTIDKKSPRAAEHYTIDKSLHELATAAIHTMFLPAVEKASGSLAKARSRAVKVSDNNPVPATTLSKLESISRALDFVRGQLQLLSPKQ